MQIAQKVVFDISIVEFCFTKIKLCGKINMYVHKFLKVEIFLGTTFFTTLEQMIVMFSFTLIGFILGKSGKLNSKATQNLATLQTKVFLPAMVFSSLSTNFTVDKLAHGARLLLISCLFMLPLMVIGKLVAKLFSKEEGLRNMYTYYLTLSNFGYLAYPVVEAVFGSEALFNLIIFTIPTNIIMSTYGYALFSKEKNVLKNLISPLMIGVALGIIIGISGLKLPTFATTILDMAGSTTGMNSMILTGLVLSSHRLVSLFNKPKGYIASFIRLIGITAIVVPIAALIGLRGNELIGVAVLTAMPGGANSLVFSVENELDGFEAARSCTISNIGAIITVPLVFGALSALGLV